MNKAEHFPKGAIVSRNVTDANGDPLDRVQYGRVIRVTEHDRVHMWCVYEVEFAAVEDLEIPANREEIYAPELRWEDEPEAFYWDGVAHETLHCVCGTPHPEQIFEDEFPSRVIRRCGQCGAVADLNERTGAWLVRTQPKLHAAMACEFCAGIMANGEVTANA
jgi:hypothetical protein